MERQKRINTLVICGLIVVISAMTIGFAALNQRLDISGTATVKNSATSWNVHFSNVSTAADTLNGNAAWTTAPTISTDSTNTGSSNKITFACDLVSPGDYCSVNATIKNGGTTEAKYTGYTLKVDDSPKTETKVTLATGAVVEITPAATWEPNTTVLAKNQTGDFVIKMSLPSTLESLPENEQNHKIELSINFTQNTNS